MDIETLKKAQKELQKQDLKLGFRAKHTFDDTALSSHPTTRLEKELEERQLSDKHYYKCFKFTYTESIEMELMRRRGVSP